MARIEIDPNYSSPTFSRATAPTDIFKKEDIQNVAAALSTHVHDGVHGLALSSNSLHGAIDIADWFRSTGHTTAFATSAAGLEMYYDAVNGGVLAAINRGSGAYQPVHVYGSTVVLSVGGVGDAVVVNGDRSVTMPGPALNVQQLGIAAGLTCGADVAITGSLSVTTGTVTFGHDLHVSGLSFLTGAVSLGGNLNMPVAPAKITFPAGGTIGDWPSGFVGINALNVQGAVTIGGTTTINGNFLAQTIYVGTDATRWVTVSGPLGITYVAGVGGVHAFVASNAQPAPITASQITVPNSVYANGCVINNSTDNKGIYLYVNGGAGGVSGWQVIPSSIRFKERVEAIGQALALVMDDALHGVHYLVSPKGVEPFEAYGFIAEAWSERAPDLVSFAADGPQGMDYGQVCAIVFEALKQYATRTDARLATLEGSV